MTIRSRKAVSLTPHDLGTGRLGNGALGGAIGLGLAALLALAVAGCSASSISASPTSIVTRVPSLSPSFAPTPTASPTPVPAGFTEQPDGSVIWLDGGGHQRTVPEFNRLKPRLEDGKVLYTDATGEAAEFKPNLVVSGEQTGVLVVRGDIVATMTQTVHDAGGYQFALPIDARSIPNGSMVSLRFDTISWGDGSSSPRAAVQIVDGNSAPLVQFNYDRPYAILMPDHNKFVVWQLFNQNNQKLPKSEIPKGHELDLTYVYGTNGGRIEPKIKSGLTETADSPVGQDFGDVSGEISIVCTSFNANVDYPISIANLLTSTGTPNGTPIAIMANG